MRLPIILLGMLLIVGCGSRPTGLPTGPAAYNVIPGPTETALPSDYRIGPLDELTVTVLQEPELSLTEVPVDVTGQIAVPLIGAVQAQGRTAADLSREIAARLGERYLVDPRVTVNVTGFASQKITVEGEVARPGSFDIPGRSTLLQAVALAQGPTETARLNEIIVFRTENGQRYVAQFDLAAIRRGQSEDPVIKTGDIVVVGYSNARRIYRDVLTFLPSVAGVFIALIPQVDGN